MDSDNSTEKNTKTDNVDFHVSVSSNDGNTYAETHKQQNDISQMIRLLVKYGLTVSGVSAVFAMPQYGSSTSSAVSTTLHSS